MDSLRSLTNTFRPLFVSVSKEVLSTILSKIDNGELQLINQGQKSTKDSASSDITFGSDNPSAVVYIKDDWFWVRTLMSGSVVWNPPLQPRKPSRERLTSAWKGVCWGIYVRRDWLPRSIDHLQGKGQNSSYLALSEFVLLRYLSWTDTNSRE